MDEKQKSLYRVFAYTFLAIGGVFLLIDILEEIFSFQLIRGNPFPAATLVILVGLALLWTVRSKDEVE
ncbi:MAG: hypothetical protein KC422_02180 [Trueperaceae bacterium]|nr:hypothetical protein [Trueperaceae bacterium]